MEEKEMVEEWFQIKHTECGATFFINASSYAKNVRARNKDMFTCPNCLMDINAKKEAGKGATDFILDFIENYQRLVRKGIKISGPFSSPNLKYTLLPVIDNGE